MAVYSGWVTLALIVIAAMLPLGYRLKNSRRAAPVSRLTGTHVGIGVAVVLMAFGHSLFGVLSLGSSSAIAAGDLAIALGGVALLVLMAHVGIGLQLRNPKLRSRQEQRRKHIATATTIAVFAVSHAVLLLTAE